MELAPSQGGVIRRPEERGTERGLEEENRVTAETTTRMRISVAPCPGCGAHVRLVGRLLIGEVFGCGHCAAQLEVGSVDPLVLEPFARVEIEEGDLV